MSRKTYRYRRPEAQDILPAIQQAVAPASPTISQDVASPTTIDLEIDESAKADLDQAMADVYWIFVAEVTP